MAAILVALVAIIAVGAMLRLPSLGVESLWYDEAATWAQVNGSFLDLLVRTAQDNYPPLPNALMFVSLHLFGDAEWSLRLPSALLGIGNIALAFWVGRRLGGPAAGLIAGLLLALSGFHIWYSQEARMYALMSFSATWLAGASLVLVDRPGWRRSLAAFLPAAALYYSHPYGIVLNAAIAGGTLVYAWRRHGLGREVVASLLAAHAAALVVFMPWAAIMVSHASSVLDQGFWIPPLSWSGVATSASNLASGRGGQIVIVAGCVLALAWPGRPRNRQRGAAGLLLVWGLFPVVAGLAFSLLVRPMLLSRYLIGILPAWQILAAIGWAATLRVPGRLQPVIVVAVAVVVVGLAALSSQATPDRRADWRGVATYLERSVAAGDCIVLAPTFALPLSYYRRQADACRLDLPADSDPGSAQFAGGDVFIVVDPCDLDQAALVGRFEAAGWFGALVPFTKLDVWRFSPRPPAGPDVDSGPPPAVDHGCAPG